MGIQIKLPNTRFKKYIGTVTYPMDDNLRGLFFLGDSKNDTIKNHANETTNVEDEGLITYHPSYASFYGNGTGSRSPGLQTDIQDNSRNITVISIFRKPDESEKRTILGMEAGSGYDLVSDINLISGDGNYANPTHLGILNNMSDFRFVATTLDGRTAKSYYMTDDRVMDGKSTTINFDRGLSSQPIRIGGTYGTYSNRGNMDLAFVSFYSKALELEEIEEVYNYLTSYYEKKDLYFL